MYIGRPYLFGWYCCVLLKMAAWYDFVDSSTCPMNIRTCTQAQTHMHLNHHAACTCIWHSQHTFCNHNSTSRPSWQLWTLCSRALYSNASIHIVWAVTIRLLWKKHAQCTDSVRLCVSHLFVVTEHWFHNLMKENVLTQRLRTLS